jgi:hypothetical protein
MEGFSGPFDYSIDGIIHSWDNLDDLIKKELKASKFTKENSLIYLCKVCVCQSDVTKQKNHDWLKIKRIFINIGIPNNSMHIIGIHPTDRERGHSNKTELPLIKSVKSEVSLFKMLQFKLSVNGIVSSATVKL